MRAAAVTSDVGVATSGVLPPPGYAFGGGAPDAFEFAAGLHVDPGDRRIVQIESRPEAWQRLADIYGPAGRRVSEYSASISETRRNQSVTTLHDGGDRLEQLLALE